MNQNAKPETERIKSRFAWSNDDWALTFLPWVRVAAVCSEGDTEKMKELMSDLLSSGSAGEVLSGFTQTKKQLEDLIGLIGAGEREALLALKRLAYSPEHLPPGGPIN